MRIVLNTGESYKLSELAKAVENSPDDLFYVVKQVDGKDVSFAITREQLLQGISGGGGSDSKFIISGGIVYSNTGLIFDQSEIVYNYYGETDTIPPSEITLDDGDSEPRFDSFVVDVATNTVVVIKGTPDANPTIPQAGEGQILITSVLIASGATTPTITTEFVYRDNTDWTTSTYTVGSPTPGTVDFESTEHPFEGTFCIKSTTSRTTGMRFQRGSSIDFGNDTGEFGTLSFRIWLSAALPANKNLLSSVWLGGSTVGATANLSNFGLDRNLVGEWQTIVLNTSVFNTSEIDRIQIRMDGGANTEQYEYFLDYIAFSSGIVAPVQIPTITFQKEGATVGTRPKLNFIEGANTTIAVVDDPVNDRVNVTITATGGGGGGTVVSVQGTTNQINVDNSDPANPILSLSNAILTQLTQIGINTSGIAALDDRVDDLEADVVQIEIDIANIQADYVKSTADFDTAGRVVIVDSTGRRVIQGSKLLADLITEAENIGTARAYTQGQGFVRETVTITSGTPNIIDWSTATSNMKYTVLNADAVLQVPTGSFDASGSWIFLNDGGFTLTFAAGLDTAYILGDTPTTTDTEKFKIDWERHGSDIWLIVNNQNA